MSVSSWALTEMLGDAPFVLRFEPGPVRAVLGIPPPKDTEHTKDTKQTLPSRVLGLHVLWPRLSVSCAAAAAWRRPWRDVRHQR
jgi:hypothetical protein